MDVQATEASGRVADQDGRLQQVLHQLRAHVAEYDSGAVLAYRLQLVDYALTLLPGACTTKRKVSFPENAKL